MTRTLSVLMPALLLAGVSLAQTPPPPSFEVADLKPADPSSSRPGKGRILPGGRIELPGATVKLLIAFAYGAQEDSISGLPKWAETDRFDLVAKAPESTAPATLRLMVQSLLADRLKLVFHREDMVKSAYVLSVGKRLSKLRAGDGGRQECSWSNAEALRRRTCRNMTMAEFARELPGAGGIGIDLPVIDETGLKGVYDFEWEVGAPVFESGSAEHGGDGKPPAAAAEPGPTIFMALDQIGLKLESRKVPVPVIVVDRIERPAGN